MTEEQGEYEMSEEISEKESNDDQKEEQNSCVVLYY